MAPSHERQMFGAHEGSRGRSDAVPLALHITLESIMNSARTLAVVAVGFIVSVYPASAQDLSRYRAYALESTLDSVITASGAHAGDVKSLHERPAKIQELEWRAPYGTSGSELADPVRTIVFTFYDDALYQVVVNYDRYRTEGLTNKDIIESLSAAYGVPVLRSAGTRISRPTAALPDTIVLAQWENTASSLTLVRGAYTPDFQLILISKPLSTRARTAIREAVRLDGIEAPRRELEQRKKEVTDASAARDKTRTTNKAAFRP
jgi:hypothetical protein